MKMVFEFDKPATRRCLSPPDTSEGEFRVHAPGVGGRLMWELSRGIGNNTLIAGSLLRSLSFSLCNYPLFRSLLVNLNL